MSASGGILDLGKHDFNGEPLAACDGEWDFYWNRLLSPEEFDRAGSVGKSSLIIPGFWNNLESGTPLFPPRGYGTLGLKIKLPPGTKGQIYGLVMPIVFASYELWINDKMLHSVGKVTVSKEGAVSGRETEILFFKQEQSEIRLLLKLSNYSVNKAGLPYSILIGQAEAAKSRKWLSMGGVLFVGGSLFIIALYHLGLYYKRRKEKFYLFFAFFCFLIILYSFLRGEHSFFLFFSGLPWDLVFRMNFLSLFLLPLAFLSFINALFPGELKFSVNRVFRTLLLGLCVIPLFASLYMLTEILYVFYVILILLCLYIIAGLVKAVKRKRPSALLFLGGFLFFFITIINDILYDFLIVQTSYFTGAGVFVFFFVQSLALSKFFSETFIEVEKLTIDLRGSNMTLQKLNKMKDKFMTRISEELKKPLNHILSITEEIFQEKKDLLNPEAGENLALISLSARRLLVLVNDILDYSKLINNTLYLSIQKIDPAGPALAATKMEAFSHINKNVKIINEIKPGMHYVSADPLRVQQIIYNLLHNSMKFTNRGFVRISACKENDFFKIIIEDTGIGIPFEMKGRIFEAFTQVDGSISRKYGGTGLGLSITRQLVNLHGGRISCESKPGRGSFFTFSLPLVSEGGTGSLEAGISPVLAEEPFIHKQEKPEGGNPFYVPGKKIVTVLVVDDDPVNVEVITNNLRLERINYKTAFSGKEALAILRAEPSIDLVLLDIMMPEMDGLETCFRIREELGLKAEYLPVILLTAKGAHKSLVEGFEAGANDFITKPFYREELRSRIYFHIHFSVMRYELENLKGRLLKLEEQSSRALLHRNEKLIESVFYAKIIQHSILPVEEDFRNLFSAFSIMCKQKDIAGGDSYWLHKVDNDHFLFAVIDCSGQGVPGAYMTILANSLLDRIVNHMVDDNPSMILTYLNGFMKGVLCRKENNVIPYAGLDISLCYFDKTLGKLYFSGAGQSLFYIRHGEVVEVKGSKRSIGVSYENEKASLSNHVVSLQEGDIFYLLTNGYLVQRGEGAPFVLGKKRFRKYLSQCSVLSLDQHKVFLEKKLIEFKGNEEQTDDITVIGMQL